MGRVLASAGKDVFQRFVLDRQGDGVPAWSQQSGHVHLEGGESAPVRAGALSVDEDHGIAVHRITAQDGSQVPPGRGELEFTQVGGGCSFRDFETLHGPFSRDFDGIPTCGLSWIQIRKAIRRGRVEAPGPVQADPGFGQMPGTDRPRSQAGREHTLQGEFEDQRFLRKDGGHSDKVGHSRRPGTGDREAEEPGLVNPSDQGSKGIRGKKPDLKPGIGAGWTVAVKQDAFDPAPAVPVSLEDRIRQQADMIGIELDHGDDSVGSLQAADLEFARPILLRKGQVHDAVHDAVFRKPQLLHHHPSVQNDLLGPERIGKEGQAQAVAGLGLEPRPGKPYLATEGCGPDRMPGPGHSEGDVGFREAVSPALSTATVNHRAN